MRIQGFVALVVLGLSLPATAAELLVSLRDMQWVGRYDTTSGEAGDPLQATSDDTPRGMTLGPDGLLYVTNIEHSSVLRFNPWTGEYVDTFVASGAGGLLHPNDLAFSPDGDLYITDFPNDQVLRYNGSTGAFAGVISILQGNAQGRPTGIAFDADGDLYVTSEGRVFRYDGSQLSLFASDPVNDGSNFWYMQFGPDGDLYVPGIYTDGVYRFDGETGELDTSFNLSVESPLGIAFGDGVIYVSSFEDGAVYRFDPVTGDFIDTFLDDVPDVADLVYLIPEPGTGVFGVMLALSILLRSRQRIRA